MWSVDDQEEVVRDFSSMRETLKFINKKWKVVVACGNYYFIVPQGYIVNEYEIVLKEDFTNFSEAEEYVKEFIASVEKHENDLKNTPEELEDPKVDDCYMYGDLQEPSTNNEKASSFPYKYNEGNVLKELEQYFQGTYGEHYSSKRNNVQTLEYIMDNFDDGKDFLKGCALKYLCRYGKKGGNNRKDLLKAIHYIIFMMYYEDNFNNNKESD